MAKDVFISYSRKDIEAVKEIKKYIDNAVGIDCWFDINGIESGEQFENVIIDAICNHNTILFMKSAQSMQSEWTLDELDFAKRKKKRIVLVHIDDSEMTDKFFFRYHKYDQIIWKDPVQRDKLIRDLKNWFPKDSQSENKAKLKEEEKAQRKEEEITRGKEQKCTTNSKIQKCPVCGTPRVKNNKNCYRCGYSFVQTMYPQKNDSKSRSTPVIKDSTNVHIEHQQSHNFDTTDSSSFGFIDFVKVIATIIYIVVIIAGLYNDGTAWFLSHKGLIIGGGSALSALYKFGNSFS